MNMTLMAPAECNFYIHPDDCCGFWTECMDAAASSISTAFNHSISTYVDPISEIK